MIKMSSLSAYTRVMKALDIALIILSIGLVAYVIFLRDDMLDELKGTEEPFAGSDWNTAFWGQSLWNGWKYGSAPPLSAPPPEDTSYLN
jgi:hypothetical protein